MFVEFVRGDPLQSRKFVSDRILDLEKPNVMAACLERQMCESSNGRLQWLKEEFEVWLRQQDLIDLPSLERRQCLRAFLKKRFNQEMDAILKEKMAGKTELYVAPVDLRRGHGDHNEGPIQQFPQFAVTETSYFDDDGLLHQSPTSSSAWRCYGICAKACANGTIVSVVETLVPAESKPEAPAEPQLPRTMRNILRGIVKVSKARGDILWLEAGPRNRDPIVHEALFELGLKNEKQPSNQLSFARIMREFIACHWATLGPMWRRRLRIYRIRAVSVFSGSIAQTPKAFLCSQLPNSANASKRDAASHTRAPGTTFPTVRGQGRQPS
jgi:hypothetical protein